MYMFTFKNEVYRNINGLKMGPVFAGIFVIEFERTVVPSPPQYKKLWKRYVADTISIIKIGLIDYILSTLNSLGPTN